MRDRYFCGLFVMVFVFLPFTGEAQDESLLVWYSFQGSGDVAQDLSGSGNDGAIVGATRVEGKYGKGLSIGKQDEYVELPDVLQDSGTIEFWFRPNWDGGDGNTYRLFDATFGDKYFFIGKGAEHQDFPNDRIGWAFEDASDADWRDSTMTASDGLILADQWYHWAAAWTFPGDAIFYLDGEEIGRHTAGALAVLNPVLRIGLTLINYVPAANGADGIVDEFAIYARELDADEIRHDMEQLATMSVEASHKLSVLWGGLKYRR